MCICDNLQVIKTNLYLITYASWINFAWIKIGSFSMVCWIEHKIIGARFQNFEGRQFSFLLLE
jgi:hypothetical protein